MAYDEHLAERLRDHLAGVPDVSEKQMFGGLSFLVGGNMAVGIIGDELCVRVGKENHDEAMAQAGARIMDFTGRPMQGWIMVGTDGIAEDAELAGWVERGVGFASSLPPK